jgi:glucose-6-phosphate 1-dehydrogenase
MAEKLTEIIINFKANEFGHQNRLYLNVSPESTIQFQLNAFNPKSDLASESVCMSTDTKSSINRWPLKDYDRLIYDAIKSNNKLFVTRQEIEASWRWIDSIEKLKQKFDTIPEIYDLPSKTSIVSFKHNSCKNSIVPDIIGF